MYERLRIYTNKVAQLYIKGGALRGRVPIKASNKTGE